MGFGGISLDVHNSNGTSSMYTSLASTTFQNVLDALKTGQPTGGAKFIDESVHGTGQEIGLSLTEGGTPLTLSSLVTSIFPGEGGGTLYALYPEPETITGFYLDGTEYKIGGGTKYNAGQGISISQENVISNSGVLSVNGQTGAVTIQTGSNYTAGNGIDITNDEIGLDGTYERDSGGKDYSAMQGPAPSGFHVPLATEWEGLRAIMNSPSLRGGSWGITLHMPFPGRRDDSSGTLFYQGSHGYYWSSSPYGSDYPGEAHYLFLNSSRSDATDGSLRALGCSIRCFKDSYVAPTSSWTVIKGTLGSAGIFWNQSEGLISVTNGTTGYTIMDKNLGATTVYNDGDTLTQANMGNIYQWGNNYGFPSTGTIGKKSETQVNASNYGPGNYYESNTFIKGSGDWSSVHNDNLRGGETGVQPIMISGNLVIGDKLYKIVTSTSAPASGTASNIITFVTA